MKMVSTIERQILQSQVVERIQQVQQQHPDMQQHYFGIQFSQERQKLKKKVNDSKNIFHATLDREAGQKKQKDHPQEQETTEQVVDGLANSESKQNDHIDIKV
jgi:hypothetical protein